MFVAFHFLIGISLMTAYGRPTQLRKLEGPIYQYKFASGRKSLSFRCSDFVVVAYGRNYRTTIIYSNTSFYSIFYN